MSRPSSFAAARHAAALPVPSSVSRGPRASAVLALCVLLAAVAGIAPAAAVPASAPLAGADPALFPVPASLHAATDFWRRVYTEIDTTQGFLHDDRHLQVVYETIELDENTSRRQRSRVVQNRVSHYRRILERLAGGRREGLSAEEARVLALWPDDVSNATLAGAAHRMRFQLGQADRFLAGIRRAGRYLPWIRAELARLGMPEELAYLPHVESSFTPLARSHAAAVGMWQFTRPTGRRFMRIDHVVDERLDPFLASSAAVRLLHENYQDLGAWPLALTAYNHGVAGMSRAVRQLGTDDIGEIVQHYDGRTFGFASRNFYASFVAAVHVHEYATQYFDEITVDAPWHEAYVEVPDFVPAGVLAATLEIDTETLRALNPALRWPVWEGQKHVPRGWRLRVPASTDLGRARAALETIPTTQRFARQTPDVRHRVERGETLSLIAARYGVPARDIAALNGLRSMHFIRVGQVLELPVRRTEAVPTPVAALVNAAAGGADGPVTADATAVDGPADIRPAAVRTDGTARQAVPGAADAPAATVATADGAAREGAPGRRAGGGTYRVRRGDTLSTIARRLGVRMNDLVAANRLANMHRLRVGQTLVVPGRGERYEPYVPELYTVQRGDSVWEVAARFQVDRDQIVALNQLRDARYIYAGQQLRLLPPESGGAGTAGE